MPWCDDCSKFWNPTSLTVEGACPTCGRSLGTPARTPWHFKLLMVAVAAYLGFRGIQGIDWVLDRL